MTMTHHPHVDPAWHDMRVRESIHELAHGNASFASTLAMMARVDAGLTGIEVCPYVNPGHQMLREQWHWGRNVALTANDIAVQGRLI